MKLIYRIKNGSLITVMVVISLCVFAYSNAHSAETSVQVFKDLFIDGKRSGPAMVLIPAGSFVMGSSDSEVGRYSDESPLHEVTFSKPFALGQKEISVAEFKQFVDATGYVTDAEKMGSSWLRQRTESFNDWVAAKVNWRHDHLGRIAEPDLPVVHVTWNDAKAYVQWLAVQTGYSYRLPSEAEFEYANRAGSQTRFWWGDHSPKEFTANVRGELDKLITPPELRYFTDEEFAHATREGPTLAAFPDYSDGFGGLAPVGSGISNQFNVYDTTGNVWEWLEDCYVADYRDAPVDGKPRLDGNCEMRVVRGGAFYCFPRHVRSANRWSRLPETRGIYIGFRVARDI